MYYCEGVIQLLYHFIKPTRSHQFSFKNVLILKNTINKHNPNEKRVRFIKKEKRKTC